MAWKESWQVKKGRQREKVSLSVYIVSTLPSRSSSILNLLVETTSSDLPRNNNTLLVSIHNFNYLFTQVLHLMFLLLCNYNILNYFNLNIYIYIYIFFPNLFIFNFESKIFNLEKLEITGINFFFGLL